MKFKEFEMDVTVKIRVMSYSTGNIRWVETFINDQHIPIGYLPQEEIERIHEQARKEWSHVE